jgi:ribose transport system permease protein
VEKTGLLLLLGLVIVVFSVLSPTSGTFPTVANTNTILAGQAVVCIVALAILVPLVAGNFDISVGANVGISSIATAAALSDYKVSTVVAMMAGATVGTIVGLVNGVLVAYLDLNSIITTLATGTIITGLVQWYTDGLPITADIPIGFANFGSLKWHGIPRPAYLLVAVTLGAWYLLDHTPFGRYLSAIGVNRRAARLVGVGVRRTVMMSFVAGGFLAGVAGVLATSRSGGGNPQLGPSYLFPALAAVALGATVIKPGRYNVFGTIVGVFFVAVTVSGLTLAGVKDWVQPVFNGVALLIAISLASFVKRRRAA